MATKKTTFKKIDASKLFTELDAALSETIAFDVKAKIRSLKKKLQPEVEAYQESIRDLVKSNSEFNEELKMDTIPTDKLQEYNEAKKKIDDQEIVFEGSLKKSEFKPKSGNHYDQIFEILK